MNTLSALIGSAWRRYDEWALVTRAELIVGGNYDGTLLWKREHGRICSNRYEALCQCDCDIADLCPPLPLHGESAPAFRRLHGGKVLSIPLTEDPDPWGAQTFDVATQPHTTFYDQLDADYRKALYDLTTVRARPRLSSV